MAPRLRAVKSIPPNGPPAPARGSRSRPGPAASVRGLSRRFGGRTVLDGLDLDIAPGEFVALIGRSGSGKSTLLRALAGLDREVTGQLGGPGRCRSPSRNPGSCRGRGCWPTWRSACGSADPPRPPPHALARSGWPSARRPGPRTLSGGEAQRASLARALVRDPALLLLDEPFSSLDALTRITMHRLVLSLWTRHRPAVLLVTHDVDEALALADRVLVLGEGRITHSSPVTLPRPAGPRPP